MIKIILILVIAITAITFSLAPNTAHSKSFFEMIFGSGDKSQKGPPPEETLQAPFPTQPADGLSKNNKLMSIYNGASGSQNSGTVGGAVNLEVPHRNETQITEWAAAIVSQALTIRPSAWEKDLRELEKNFTPFAAEEYKSYLQKMNVMGSLTTNNMSLQAISESEGIILKEGAISGTYHWLVEVPILTSFYKDSMQEIDKRENFQSQNMIVQVQIGRVPPKDSADIGLTIERWSVSSVSK